MDTPKVKINKWFIAYKNLRESENIFDMSDVIIIEPKPDTYNADPFLFESYIFYELYDYIKGVIAYRHIEEDGTLGEETVCLERPYHLSFPFLIEDNEEIYMIPETGQANCIEIYKATEFPDKWVRVKTLIENVCAGDSVIYKRDDGYYLFTTTEGDHKPVIYHARSLLGEYTKVWSSEIMNSRPAGNIFELNGKLYKPVQDGTDGYGQAVLIKEFSFFPYNEKEFYRIGVDWYPDLIGCHTFNFNDKYIIIDGKVKL